MFRKQLALAGFLVASLLSKAQNNPFYYEHISNESKSTDFVFAFYPSSYQHFELKENDTCTTFKSIVINKAAGSLVWDDYKLRIQLRDGKVVTSLNATNKESRLATNYTVAASETHEQFYCFNAKFTNNDIGKIWLVMSDDKSFALEYYKNEK